MIWNIEQILYSEAADSHRRRYTLRAKFMSTYRHIGALSILLLPLLLFACSLGENAGDIPVVPAPVVEAPEPILEEEDLVTYNVTYTGIVEEGGMTIYQEGSHRLMLSDGKMVLLEGELPIDLYVGKLVRVKGDVMPTVEAGGTIMDVKEIAWIRRELDEDGDETEALRTLCGGESGAGCPAGSVCELQEDGPGVCTDGEGVDESAAAVSDSEDEDETDTDNEEDVDSEGSSADTEAEDAEDSDDDSDEEESEPSTEVDADLGSTVLLMVDEDYTSDRWTQEYCSSHIQFCVEIHKNWYYKSFGATASHLWHIEMGASAVESFGNGPIVVSLKSGDLSALGVQDGEVKVINKKVIGYRSWSDSRHFEISASAALGEPVGYITRTLI